MKKASKMILAMAAGLVLTSGSAFAFHGGGVAHCDGCHSMHNSADNARSGSATAASLMKGSDASSTCLNCHTGANSYHINSVNGANKNQGGDFFWVSDAATHDYLERGTVITFNPDNKGHNVIAADFGLSIDATNTTAPGGTMNSGLLGCTSCHDPHGQIDGGTANGAAPISVSGSYLNQATKQPPVGTIAGNYRLLGDTGFKQITANAPVATADTSAGTKVNYGTGMSDWCLSCHPSFNDNTNMHPTDVPVPVSYNSYVKTGDFTGTVATAFDPLVPIERGVSDGKTLDPASTAGVTGTDQVMCLSCHRAHASAFDNALRWDSNTSEFIAGSAILKENTSTLMANGAVPYYANGAAVDVVAKYGQYQRQLCNKCHAKD
ncbi:MAG: hypothetical protein NDI73_09300 [Desulfuromonadales bacterium]|nr:hypothetical protein [Desulfuromonadales bacterium]